MYQIHQRDIFQTNFYKNLAETWALFMTQKQIFDSLWMNSF